MKGYSVLFHHGRCTISDKDDRLIAHGELDGRVSILKTSQTCTNVHNSLVCYDCDYSELKLWHQRRISRNVKCSLPFCFICVMGKLHHAPHKPLNKIRSSQKLQFIHSDICGPMIENSVGGHRYFSTFIDDYS
ncbi:hypothetical protein GJ496_006004 [Pomphorhynchus laevis]|nr:hypothetical protein GJ496_006004 [Pomphorhynchus laevis]